MATAYSLRYRASGCEDDEDEDEDEDDEDEDDEDEEDDEMAAPVSQIFDLHRGACIANATEPS